MRADLREAIESARTVAINRHGAHEAKPQRTHSTGTVRAILLSLARDLPEDMTMGDIREELGG